jgi:excisionase family DNA binding protein
MTVRLVYRVPEVCEMLGIGRTTFYRWAESGDIAVIKVGSMTFVNRDELERLFKVRIPTPDQPSGSARDTEDNIVAIETARHR